MEEVWKDIPGYEGMYQMSNTKKVKSLKRINEGGRLLKERILTPVYSGNAKIPIVWVRKDGKPKGLYIERLYFELFERK